MSEQRMIQSEKEQSLYTTIQNRHRNSGRYFKIVVYPGSS